MKNGIAGEQMERRCFACNHVFLNERPVCHVVFFDDGEIQIDCGQDDHGEGDEFPKNFRPVGLNHIIARDETVAALLAEEAPDVSFGRDSVDQPWSRYIIR
ncbi:hypothetical protein [Bosea sp. UC22_33]|uniref:hypothetical protein n=1 Tax=Bosea sp. UC22_33 TaxID=3350165 RepID=UPI0036724E43